MRLNFSNMSDEEIKATIVHQFGHALGLGHTMMKPDVWEELKPYCDLKLMNTKSNVEEYEFAWTGKRLEDGEVNYDEKSVMEYR
jgi:hypothetical protein